MGENPGCGVLVLAAIVFYIAAYMTVLLFRVLSGDII
jgi:hypothetical protein